MSYRVEEIAGPYHLGEGAHWDDERQCLYFVDGLDSSVHRYVPSEKKAYKCQIGTGANDFVSIIIPVKNETDKYLITLKNQLAVIKWDGISPKPEAIRLIRTLDKEEGTMFNDGKVDPTGRLWVGTFGCLDGEEVKLRIGVGALYSFSDTLEPTKREKGVTISNGMAWSPDLKHMYYIDTPTHTVDVFDYDSITGSIGNRRVLTDLTPLVEIVAPEYGGDGMTVDFDGNLWVAIFNGSCVLHIDGKTGKLLKKIELPTPNITTVAFGGPALDELFVLSSKFRVGSDLYSKAGMVYRITGLGVKGLPIPSIDLSKISSELP